MTAQHFAKTVLFTLHNIKDLGQCKCQEHELLTNLSTAAFVLNQKCTDVTEARKFKALAEYLNERAHIVFVKIFS